MTKTDYLRWSQTCITLSAFAVLVDTGIGVWRGRPFIQALFGTWNVLSLEIGGISLIILAVIFLGMSLMRSRI